MIVSLLESSASGRLLGSVVRRKRPTEGESDHVTSPCQKRGREQSRKRCEQDERLYETAKSEGRKEERKTSLQRAGNGWCDRDG